MISKLAAYLDEAGDDLVSGCKTLQSLNIRNVALRNIWTSNICNATDQTCQNLKEVLIKHDLKVIMIASDLGNMSLTHLSDIPKSIIDRSFNVATYFGASHIRIYCGTSMIDGDPYVDNWFRTISERAIEANITPLLEVTYGSMVYKPIDIIRYLAKYRRWKLLYDPAQLIIKQSQDPFIKYWTLLKGYIDAIDIHDYKIGVGHKPCGHGDTRILETLKDAQSSGYNGWYIFEPALGRRHGKTKSDIFKMAFDAIAIT